MADQPRVDSTSNHDNFRRSRFGVSAAMAALQRYAWGDARPTPFPVERIPELRRTIAEAHAARRERGDDARSEEWLLECFPGTLLSHLLDRLSDEHALEKRLPEAWHSVLRAVGVVNGLLANAPDEDERERLAEIAEGLTACESLIERMLYPNGLPVDVD